MLGINFDLGEDVDMLRDAIWAFAQKEILPRADDGARRLADVLRQRHRHPVGEGQAPYPALRRQLAAWRMHAALEGFAAKVGDEFHWLS